MFPKVAILRGNDFLMRLIFFLQLTALLSQDEAAGLRAGAQRQHCLTCKISHHRKLPPLAAGRVSHEISLDSLCLATDRSTFVLTFRGREGEFIIAGRLDCFQVSQVPLLSCSDIHCREPDYHQVLLSILTLTARLGFLKRAVGSNV